MTDRIVSAGNEAARLEALRALQIIGTPPEAHFDAVCRTSTILFDLPIALVSLIEEDAQWFKAKCGLAVDGTGRDVAFCSHTVLSDTVMVVEDATRDARFSQNPLVTGAPGIRFYAGAPLILGPGIRVGTLCVIDTRPRTFSEAQCRQLEDLATIVVAQLRLHAANAQHRHEIAARQEHEAVIANQAQDLEQHKASLGEANRLLVLAEQVAHVGHWHIALPSQTLTWSDEVFRIYGVDRTSFEPSMAAAIDG
ncbi:GAF domain-containing protein, partial [Methylobacterium iners]|uniref:GAF domain-containing protein n=1 Tax=Methylobacterium iners TaxID=418707 RepID=UPI001EE1F5FB